MSRTRKKPYTKSKKVSKGCRCHGNCSYCRNDRMYSTIRKRRAAEEELKEVAASCFIVTPAFLEELHAGREVVMMLQESSDAIGRNPDKAPAKGA